jgi:uroporphyrinogen-III decarboxylase
MRIINYLKQAHPDVPVAYFANGGSVYLHSQLDMNCDAIQLDWKISMAQARKIAGKYLFMFKCLKP